MQRRERQLAPLQRPRRVWPWRRKRVWHTPNGREDNTDPSPTKTSASKWNWNNGGSGK